MDVLRRLAVAIVILVVLSLTGCSSNPAKPSCVITVAPADQSRTIGAASASFSIGVQAPAGCAWTATTSSEFLTIKAGASGTGNGTVQVDVRANKGGNRIGTVAVGGAILTVTQNGAPCEFSVTPTNLQFPFEGGEDTISIQNPRGGNCAWTATSTDVFLLFLTPQSGVGSGSVKVGVSLNENFTRAGSLTVAGQSVTATQAAGCRYYMSPIDFNVPAGNSVQQSLLGGYSLSDRFGVCPTPVGIANSPFIHIQVSPDNGEGILSAHFTIDANPGPPRVGTATVGGVLVTFHQAGSSVRKP